MVFRASHLLCACRYYARVVQVFPPRSSLPGSNSRASPSSHASSSSSSVSDEESIPIHKIAEDLKIPVSDAIARDDPDKYYYKIQILEEDKSHGAKAGERTKGKEATKSKYSGSLMDVRCTDMRYVILLYLPPSA